MRCKICDFSPTAPSLSLPVPPRGVKLKWDEKEQGWTCGNTCGMMDVYQEDEEEEVEIDNLEDEITLPEDRM